MAISRQQLIGLLETAREPLRQVLADRGLPRDKADAFLDEAIPVIRAVFAADRPADPESLPELNVARPLHLRYAPPDPLEPLHWDNTERYLKKMAQLGYTL